MTMTTLEIAKACDELDRLAAGLGLDPARAHQIGNEVEAQARSSLTWGTIEQRLAEVRRRLIVEAS